MYNILRPLFGITCSVCVVVTSDHSDDDVVFVDGNSMVGATAQGVRWSHYQPTTWTSLLDEQYHEMSAFIFVFYLSIFFCFICS